MEAARATDPASVETGQSDHDGSESAASAPPGVSKPAQTPQSLKHTHLDSPAARPTTPTIFTQENTFQSPKPASIVGPASAKARRFKEAANLSEVSIEFTAPRADPPQFQGRDLSGAQLASSGSPSTPSLRKKSLRRKPGQRSPSTPAADQDKGTSPAPDDDETTTVQGQEDETQTATDHSERPIITPKKMLDSEFSLQERLLRRNRTKKASPRFNPLAAVLCLLSLFLAHYSLVDYPRLGYCTQDAPAASPVKPHTPFYSFMPSCIPCPQDTVCSFRSVTGCVEGAFRLKKNLLARLLPESFLFFPLNQPYCVPDTSRDVKEGRSKRQVEQLIKVLEKLVREYSGEVLCSIRKAPSYVYSAYQPHRVLGMPITAAKAKLQELVAGKWSSDKFEEYWSKVLDALAKESHTLSVIVDEKTHQYRLLSSTLPAVSSWYCSIKLHLWNLLLQHAISLMLAGACAIAGLVGYVAYQRHLYESQVFASLLQDVIQSVHAETDNYHQNPSRHPIPGLSIVQLKDHFLPAVPPASAGSATDQMVDNLGRKVWFLAEPSRTRVWKRVAKEVVKNANIRETTAHVKGEAHTVWMWIGSSALSPMKKRKTDQL
ncbi:inner nuclear membrane protein enriched at telomere/subtelomere region [Kappamyces sp. JEL0829]|nr:inner nuclear membrane protein enriched at telomere/subtelomere region [Kappamyces sp. JEL0829]